MYRTFVASPQQAVVHLLLHCSNKKGEFRLPELTLVAGTVELLGCEQQVNLDREIENYLFCLRQGTDENAFLLYLVSTINPRLKLALFWHCVQIMANDSSFAFAEELLLQKIANLLQIKPECVNVLYELAVQMNKAQTSKTL